MSDNQKTKKAFVTYVIEQSLFEIGGSQLLDEVSNLIQEKYGCNIIECYRHPDYLNNVLDVIYGKSHKHIVNLIQEKLSDFLEIKPITEFLTILR